MNCTTYRVTYKGPTNSRGSRWIVHNLMSGDRRTVAFDYAEEQLERALLAGGPRPGCELGVQAAQGHGEADALPAERSVAQMVTVAGSVTAPRAAMVRLCHHLNSFCDDEDLRAIAEEEQEAFDNLPEGLQESERGQRSQEAADALAEAADEVSNAVDAAEAATTAIETASE